MQFRDQLKEGMQKAKITAAELSRKTGISQSLISQYLAGYTEPRQDKKAAISQALNIQEDAPEQPDPFTVTVEQVAKIMHLAPDTVRIGLQQRVFAWGYAIKLGVNSEGKENWSYKINRIRFREIEHVEI